MTADPIVARGACHCGGVRFTVRLQPDFGTTQCNCRFCTKHGWWGTIVKPSAFTLDSGEASVEVRDPNPIGERLRCPTCGIVPFGRGDLPELGGAFVSVNVRCLEDLDLAGVPVAYLDGAADTWALLHARPWRSPFLPEAA